MTTFYFSVSLKNSTARQRKPWENFAALWYIPDHISDRRKEMTQKTCAACDCPLDDNVIKVKLGGRTVEVCCEECAVKLKEAYVSAATPEKR